MRSTLGDEAHRRLRQITHDRQILKCLAQVIVLAEATRETELLLQQTRSHGNQDGSKLDQRDTTEHWVQRVNEKKTVVLIAARKDVATHLDCMEFEAYEDHPYTQQSKSRIARSRIMVCRVRFKQNIDHLGKDSVVGSIGLQDP